MFMNIVISEYNEYIKQVKRVNNSNTMELLFDPILPLNERVDKYVAIFKKS